MSGICLDFKMLNKMSLYVIKCFLTIYNSKCISKLNSLFFSINNLRQNVGSVHDRPFQNPFCVSVINTSEYFCSCILRILEYIL